MPAMWASTNRMRRVHERRPSGKTPAWRLRQWLRRYLPAELLAIVVAAVCATCADAVSNDQLVVVGASIVGSSTGYYGLIVMREMIHARRASHARHIRDTRRAGYTTVRNLALDFGSAELLDSLLFSPALLYLWIQAVPNLQLAVLLGEVASTSAFYSAVVVAHNVRRAFAGAANELA